MIKRTLAAWNSTIGPNYFSDALSNFGSVENSINAFQNTRIIHSEFDPNSLFFFFSRFYSVSQHIWMEQSIKETYSLKNIDSDFNLSQ